MCIYICVCNVFSNKIILSSNMFVCCAGQEPVAQSLVFASLQWLSPWYWLRSLWCWQAKLSSSLRLCACNVTYGGENLWNILEWLFKKLRTKERFMRHVLLFHPLRHAYVASGYPVEQSLVLLRFWCQQWQFQPCRSQNMVLVAYLEPYGSAKYASQFKLDKPYWLVTVGAKRSVHGVTETDIVLIKT